MGGRRKHQGGGGHNVPRIPAVDAQLDELDTQAYVSAEAVLTEPQREPARKFASAYREALFDWRRATHGKAE